MKHSNNTPDFRDSDFLYSHIKKTLAFYHPECVDQQKGGFFHYYKNDGEIYNKHSKHLVSSTRFVFNYAMAAQHLLISDKQKAEYIQLAKHGIEFLRMHHRNQKTGGYAWILEDNTPVDATNHCYGLAFVLLAYSTAYKAGISETLPFIHETFELMEKYFWSEHYGLYRDEISSDWKTVSPYRGQNANMHSCEALIAAYEASNEKIYLKRAFMLADNICNRQANLAGGNIWEHYDQHWQVDWNYNRDNPKHLFRPWGFQSGHLTEWSKLLLILERHQTQEWLLPRALALFNSAIEIAWDKIQNGMHYGFAPDKSICDSDKYFWVQAESLAAAALLADRSNDSKYWDWYDRIWKYSWNHMIDHQYGAWYRILDANNQSYDDCKSPAGKTDYHTMGACYEVLRILNRHSMH